MEVQELINNGWRYIKYKGIDFTNMYLINEYGDVLSLNYRGKRGSIHPLTYYINHKGYKAYRLNYKGTSYMAFSHRLVAEMFIPNPDRLPQVNHKDENKLNNHYSNLEWCDSKYNSNYGTRNERSSYANTGHRHSKSGVNFYQSRLGKRIFAMQLGTGINQDAYAFAYNKFGLPSHVNVGIIKNGVPIIEYME